MGRMRKVIGPRAYRADPRSVTSIAPHEVDARSVGLRRRDVEAIWKAVQGYYRTGLQPAMQLCIRHRGQVIMDRAIGFARGGGPDSSPGTPRVLATPTTLFNLFSASKAVTAMLIHLLVERGQLHLDAPVADYFPEFAARGKGGITLRHVLTHRAGIPKTAAEHINPDLLSTPERLVELMVDSEPETRPGERLAYMAINGGFVLAEVIRRVTGQGIRDFLRHEMLDPLGFEHLSYGVPPEEADTVAEEALTGPMLEVPFGRLMRRSLGMSLGEAVSLSNDRRFVTGVVPSGNVYGTANEVSRYFELLMRGGALDGVRIFSPATIKRAVAPQNGLELDRTIGLPIRYGMGFMLGGRRFSFYGARSEKAFGHLGFTNVLAYADPERDLSVALMNNGNPLITPELLLWLNITYAIARRIPRVIRL